MDTPQPWQYTTNTPPESTSNPAVTSEVGSTVPAWRAHLPFATRVDYHAAGIPTFTGETRINIHGEYAPLVDESVESQGGLNGESTQSYQPLPGNIKQKNVDGTVYFFTAANSPTQQTSAFVGSALDHRDPHVSQGTTSEKIRSDCRQSPQIATSLESAPAFASSSNSVLGSHYWERSVEPTFIDKAHMNVSRAYVNLEGESPSSSQPLPDVKQENFKGTIYFYPAGNSTSRYKSTFVSSEVNQQGPFQFAQGSVASTIPKTFNATVFFNQEPRSPEQPLSNVKQENFNGTIYFSPSVNNTTRDQPNPSLFVRSTNVPKQPEPTVPLARQPQSPLFMREKKRSEILSLNAVVTSTLTNAELEQYGLPYQLDSYRVLYPLEPMDPYCAKSGHTSVYRAIHITTGSRYCLRIVQGFNRSTANVPAIVDLWKKVQHSNVVQLREAFTTTAFGERSVVFIYDYFPGAQTLMHKYFATNPIQSRVCSRHDMSQLSENDIWSMIIQLTGGLRAIHSKQLACKNLDATKIIVTGKRIRYSFCGVRDILAIEPQTYSCPILLQMHQQGDFTALGNLILGLACKRRISRASCDVRLGMQFVSRYYSTDLKDLIEYLLITSKKRSLIDIMSMTGARVCAHIDKLQQHVDSQTDDLMKELDNKRLYTIMMKLNSINERSSLNSDPQWSETGDRYMLKLFRDYVFHTVDANGYPWLDHAHVRECLNKFDAGMPEKIMLMSRDEEMVLIVSYTELKRCFNNAYSELESASTTSSSHS